MPPEQIGDIDETPAEPGAVGDAACLRQRPSERRPLDEPSPGREFPAREAPADRHGRGAAADARGDGRSAAAADLGAFPSTAGTGHRGRYESENNGATGCRFAFTSEAGWRLHGQLTRPRDAASPAPAVIALRSPDEERGATERFAGQIRAPWLKAVVETRGTGDTAWGQDLHWHARRAAAWTGRTIASMRVWDTLRAIEAVRSLPGVAPEQIALAARGEMAAVALDAALLDGRIHTIILEISARDPERPQPARRPRPRHRDAQLPPRHGSAAGRRPALSRRDAIVGDRPDTYAWAEDLYRQLGASGRFRYVPIWRRGLPREESS